MLGEKHKAIANWLVIDWNSDNARVCVVEGFSGVGKSEVASEFERRTAVVARVDAPESGELDDLLLDLSEQLAVSGHLELANAIDDGRSTEVAFEAILQKPVHIIIDEFQRMVDIGTGKPSQRIAQLIERVSKRAGQGRLLLLSHHAMDKTHRWGERVAFKTLVGLSPEEGAELLSQLLAARGRETDIPPERREEISRWLGGNPRAIRVLVGCLEQEALDDLTGVVPEAWEARDQDVSQGLISKLERELLVRALENLDGASASTLENLSVYRKSVTGDGISSVLTNGHKLEQFLAALSSRFLLEQRAGWYTLNPIVREISLHRLKENPRATQTAHRAAAGIYTRHFKSKQIVNAGKLGGTFIEARYHLVQASELDELAELAQRFGDHLRSMYGWVTPEPTDERKRDEVIAILSAYLQEEGPKAMEYHLARLLYSRNRPGDRQRALEHARRSTEPNSRADGWVLRLRLEAEVASIESMLQVAREGFSQVPLDGNLFAVYQMAADKLAEVGRIPEAIKLLDEGISRVSPEKSAYSLYLAEAGLLVASGEADDAILLLRRALVIIPAEFGLSAIYTRIAQILTENDQLEEALELLNDGLTRIPAHKALYTIYLTIAELLTDNGRVIDAVDALEAGLQKIPTNSGRHFLQALLKRLLSTSSSNQPLSNSNDSTAAPASAPIIDGPPARRRVHVLALGTEWESRHGGLSTFNRELCVALASAGHYVVCIVPESADQERKDAMINGVHLLSPPPQPGLEELERLLLKTSLPIDFQPELVIGHDRKTGPHAKVLVERFVDSKFILFVHTRPEDIEWHKDKLGPDDAASTGEKRRRLLQDLASSAAVVVGVGPQLAKSAETLVFLAEPQPVVHQMDPGFTSVSRPSRLPPEIHCLVLGRAEDLTLKGLDIAARALAEVTRRNKLESTPRLVVRGAPVGTGRELRAKLLQFGNGKLDVEVRDYSPDVELLREDILRSSLVLMPSRSEGFGLVALEAIAAKTPVLVSDKSGIAMLLKDRLGQDSSRMIVETQDDLERSALEWDRLIEAVLLHRSAAFARAAELQSKLSPHLNWTDAVLKLEDAWTPLLTDVKEPSASSSRLNNTAEETTGAPS